MSSKIELKVSVSVAKKIHETLGYNVETAEVVIENSEMWESKREQILPFLQKYCENREMGRNFFIKMAEYGIDAFVCGSHIAFHTKATGRFAMFYICNGKYSTL